MVAVRTDAASHVRKKLPCSLVDHPPPARWLNFG